MVKTTELAKLPEPAEVGIVMGSDSDWPLLEDTVGRLNEFGVRCEVRVISAHRSPGLASGYATRAAQRGLKVLIAAAGGAAHLGGVLAAHTTLPVIAIPVTSALMDGLDSLLSTVQMPAGVPVATVAVGKAGAANAALLAVQILAVSRPDLARKLVQHKRALIQKVQAADARVQAEAQKQRAPGAGARR
jgi:5-(carboxyamino)imidazole ribonucleotide mutase